MSFFVSSHTVGTSSPHIDEGKNVKIKDLVICKQKYWIQEEGLGDPVPSSSSDLWVFLPAV